MEAGKHLATDAAAALIAADTAGAAPVAMRAVAGVTDPLPETYGFTVEVLLPGRCGGHRSLHVLPVGLEHQYHDGLGCRRQAARVLEPRQHGLTQGEMLAHTA